MKLKVTVTPADAVPFGITSSIPHSWKDPTATSGAGRKRFWNFVFQNVPCVTAKEPSCLMLKAVGSRFWGTGGGARGETGEGNDSEKGDRFQEENGCPETTEIPLP